MTARFVLGHRARGHTRITTTGARGDSIAPLAHIMFYLLPAKCFLRCVRTNAVPRAINSSARHTLPVGSTASNRATHSITRAEMIRESNCILCS